MEVYKSGETTHLKAEFNNNFESWKASCAGKLEILLFTFPNNLCRCIIMLGRHISIALGQFNTITSIISTLIYYKHLVSHKACGSGEKSRRYGLADGQGSP